MPILFIAIAKATAGLKNYDNNHPREYLSQLKGRSFRAKSAHDNSWEAFAPFAVAISLAIYTGVKSDLIDQIAVTFIVSRFIYGLLYIFDYATARSIVWFIGLSCTAALYYLAWSA